MTQPAQNPCSVSIAANDYRYYVKDISIMDSVVQPVASDARYRVIPEHLALWDSVANYRSVFEPMAVSPVINPAVFRPDPHTGDYRNLYKPENSVGIQWDSTVYNSANSMTFPKGMLKPVMPVVEYNVDAYQPSLGLDIPVIPVPQDRTPSLTLPDIVIPDPPDPGVGSIAVSCDIGFIAASVHYSNNSKKATIVIDWAVPPSTTGLWLPIVRNGQCLWNTVRTCYENQSE